MSEVKRVWNDVYNRQVWWVLVQSTRCCVVWLVESDIIWHQTSRLYVQHTQFSGMLFVEDTQNVLFITTYTLQLHNTANITNRMPTSTNTHMKPNTTDKELANHWCMIRTNLPHQKVRHLGVPEESSRDTRHISFNNGTVPGKNRTNGKPSVVVYTSFSLKGLC